MTKPELIEEAKVSEEGDDRLSYTMPAYIVQRRNGAWYAITSADLAFKHLPTWLGPFATIDTVCISMARHQAADIADRHTQDIERLGLRRGDPRYGLQTSHRIGDFLAKSPPTK